MDEKQLATYIVEQAERNPEFRNGFIDYLREKMTDHAPTSEAYMTLKAVRDGLEELGEKGATQ